MKRMKKFLAMFLAMAMVLGMSMTTFAEAAPGTITVNNTTEGTKLAAMQIIKPDSTAKTGWAFVDGVESAFTSVFTEDVYKTDNATDAQKIIWSLLQKQAAAAKTPEWAQNIPAATASQLQDALENVMKLAAFPQVEDATFANNTSSIVVLPSSIPDGKTAGDYAGLYAVKAAEAGFSYSLMTAFIPLNGDTVGTAVVANAKKVDIGGEDGPFDKTDKAGNLAAIGEKVKYEITTVVPYIPEDIDDATLEYEITDTLTGASYVKSNDKVDVVVTVDGVDKTSDVTVTMNTVTGKESFTIELDNIAKTRSNANAELVIAYYATITDVNAHNDAEADYGTLVDYEGQPVIPPSDDDDVFTGSITMTKTGENEETKLSGAQFRVYFMGKVDETDGIVKESTETDAEKYYATFDADTNQVSGWTTNKDDASLTQATDAAGEVTVTGLKYGVNYKFEEAVAPKGYSINTTDSPVTWTTQKVDGSQLTEDNYQTILAGTASMEDTTLAQLPSTGGIGTTIFTVGGCAIMIIAAGLYFASRRKAAK